MRSKLTALLAAALLGAGCGAPDADAEGTEATTQDLLEATGAAEPAPGSLPPGAPRALPGSARQEQTVDIAVMGVDRGDPDSPVRVVEFSDYGCGYCRKFHQETFPLLVEKYIGVGKVEWKFLPYVSGMFRNSPTATLGAECALEQGEPAFEALNARLWDGQAEWKGASDPHPVVRGMAEAAGVDMGEWDTCMTGGRRGWRVDAATQLARQLGVRATPTFFVVGYPPLQGALPTEVFQQVLDMVYADATRGGGDR